MEWSTVAVSAFSGLAMGLSLIVAIGAQNAFILQQGLRREFVWPVVTLCTLSDLILISLGVLGAGALLDAHPALIVVARWAGAAVLVIYAGLSVRRMITGGSLETSGGTRRRLGPVLATSLALTWLNPHVYLDTVVLMGTLAAGHGPGLRWWFAGGAMVASTLWFGGLGLLSGRLSSVLRTRRAWRILDGVIAVIMVSSAARLVLSS